MKFLKRIIIQNSGSPVWNSFEHLIWRNLTDCGLAGQEDFLLAVSGGLDSMVLVEVLTRLKPSARIKLAHFHHGLCENSIQQEYRDQSLSLVAELALIKNIPFISERATQALNSEDDFRKARWNFLRAQKKPGQIIVTAHHRDDSFETMLLKLIRGTSLEGLTAFKMKNDEIFRPFLSISKNELLAYAETNKFRWVEDPSNKDPQYLRNWLRESWLPMLEKRSPGAVENFARSLENIIETSTEIQPFGLKYAAGALAIDRAWYGSLAPEQKLRALAIYLRENSVFEFTTGQLNEIRKRLDKNQKDITFDLVGKKWVINATQIMLE